MSHFRVFPGNTAPKRTIDMMPTSSGVKKPRTVLGDVSANNYQLTRPGLPKQLNHFATGRPNQRAQLKADSPYFRGQPQPRAALAMPPRPVLPAPFAIKKFDQDQHQCILSGTVEKIAAWKALHAHLSAPCLLEVWGRLDYVRSGSSACLKTFTMRDKETGPVIKVVFCEMDRPLLELNPGELVSVVGVLRAKSYVQAFKVTKITQQDLVFSQHITFICDNAVKEAVLGKNV